MGTHDSWPEVRRIFQEASDRDGADRDAFLATVPDGPVLDEVRSLLAWHSTDIDFLETPAVAPFATAAASSPESAPGASSSALVPGAWAWSIAPSGPTRPSNARSP
jgi:hypothetical protein